VQLYSGTGLFSASLVLFSPVPDSQDAGLSGIPALQCCGTATFVSVLKQTKFNLNFSLGLNFLPICYD
jgi:hypothetical protein